MSNSTAIASVADEWMVFFEWLRRTGQAAGLINVTELDWSVDDGCTKRL